MGDATRSASPILVRGPWRDPRSNDEVSEELWSEADLAFRFREDVPAEVLACFSLAHSPAADSSRDGEQPPALPQAVEDAPSAFEHMDVDRPWAVCWPRLFVSGTVTDTYRPNTYIVLAWRYTQWSLITRFAWQTDPDSLVAAISWLGPFIDSDDGHPFVGTVLSNMLPAPQLLFALDGRLCVDDPNQPRGLWARTGWLDRPDLMTDDRRG